MAQKVNPTRPEWEQEPCRRFRAGVAAGLGKWYEWPAVTGAANFAAPAPVLIPVARSPRMSSGKPPFSLKVSPSIIAGNQGRLADEVVALEQAGADMIHLDVMDGHFVPNLTMGPGIIADLRPVSSLPFDTHLMLSEPWKYIDAFVKAGSDRISVHVETEGVGDTLRRIRDAGVSPGIVINPPTPVEMVSEYLGLVDFVLVMTVNPGFYGQKLIPEALDKLPVLRKNSDAFGRDIAIQVDGGINLSNIERVARAGADEVVGGAAVLKAADYRQAIETLRRGGIRP